MEERNAAGEKEREEGESRRIKVVTSTKIILQSTNIDKNKQNNNKQALS